jgi:hypothetical protein
MPATNSPTFTITLNNLSRATGHSGERIFLYVASPSSGTGDDKGCGIGPHDQSRAATTAPADGACATLTTDRDL